jgi:hypothetical protein
MRAVVEVHFVADLEAQPDGCRSRAKPTGASALANTDPELRVSYLRILASPVTQKYPHRDSGRDVTSKNRRWRKPGILGEITSFAPHQAPRRSDFAVPLQVAAFPHPRYRVHRIVRFPLALYH